VKLKVSVGDLQLLRRTQDGCILGIILRSGRVLFAASDPVRLRGHADWVQRDRLRGCFRGFSLVVRAGHVTALIRQSGMNPEAAEYRLEVDLLKLLPLAQEYEFFAE
jgi:hypothetical protein